MAVRQAFQNIAEIGEGFDVVELCGRQQGSDDRPAFCAAIGACEQVVLAAERNGPDGTFDGVVIKLDAAVIEEPAKRSPAGEGVSDRIRNATAGWETGELGLEPDLHRGDQRQRPATTYASACLGGLAPDARLDRIELADAPERFGGDGRAGCLMHLVELAPRVSPAGCQVDMTGGG